MEHLDAQKDPKEAGAPRASPTFVFIFKHLFLYLKGRATRIEGETERMFICWFALQMVVVARATMQGPRARNSIWVSPMVCKDSVPWVIIMWLSETWSRSWIGSRKPGGANGGSTHWSYRSISSCKHWDGLHCVSNPGTVLSINFKAGIARLHFDFCFISVMEIQTFHDLTPSEYMNYLSGWAEPSSIFCSTLSISSLFKRRCDHRYTWGMLGNEVGKERKDRREGNVTSFHSVSAGKDRLLLCVASPHRI